jgi:polyhydroxyalkanoate synthase subunit PhaC
MNDQPRNATTGANTADLQQSMTTIAERSQRLVTEFLAKQASGGSAADVDPLNVGNAFMEMTAQMMANPAQMMESSLNLWQDYLGLWQNTASRMMGQDTSPAIEPAGDDRRFRDEAWTENNVFDFIKQSYLLSSRWMQSTVNSVEGLDDQTAKKVDFYTRQLADALSPTNFAMTNPEVLRETVETGGENLVRGLENLLEDMERGDGQLKIKMTDPDDFALGDTIATSTGKVVFRNDLMELIQFDARTDQVLKTPVVIVPPWINKYYILDLREKNSFIKWATEQGHTVFVVSWVNPDEKLAQKTFEDYMMEGPLAAIDAVQAATGADKVNMIGYCIGGTLLASALAYMSATGDDRVKSATFFTSLVDFKEAGDLCVFIDEDQVQKLEETMNERGYLEGGEMASTFNMMRANDLIWSFVVNNYLMGKDPFPFDLLYWNADSTRMPAAMHSFYLRNMYMENNLVKPGGITLNGVDLDLRKIEVPTYIVSTREDHIAPWVATYSATQLYSGPIKFVLSGSGHIAGIINPPASGKYGFWTNAKKPKSPDKWLEGATKHDGSWWADWDTWAKKHSPKKLVPARVPGDGKLKPICDAPGEYVTAKA